MPAIAGLNLTFRILSSQTCLCTACFSKPWLCFADPSHPLSPYLTCLSRSAPKRIRPCQNSPASTGHNSLQRNAPSLASPGLPCSNQTDRNHPSPSSALLTCRIRPVHDAAYQFATLHTCLIATGLSLSQLDSPYRACLYESKPTCVQRSTPYLPHRNPSGLCRSLHPQLYAPDLPNLCATLPDATCHCVTRLPD